MPVPPAADCDTCGEEPRSRKMTRRALLAGAAATSAGAAALAAGGATATSSDEASAGETPGTSPDPLPVLVGTVAAAGAQQVRVDPVQSGREATRVTLQPDAKVWRLGDAALSDYAVGDDISVYGHIADDGTVVASMVTCDLYSVQGPVRSPRSDSVTIGTTPLSVGPRMETPDAIDAEDEFTAIAPADVPGLRKGAEARALVLRNTRGPGLIWKMGVR